MNFLFERITRNPIAPYLLTLLALVAGLLAADRVLVRFFPPFEIGLIVVSTPWPDVAAEEIEESISVPMENEMLTISDTKAVYAVSQKGASIIYLEFNDGANMDEAANDVRAALAKVNLPNGSEASNVAVIDPRDVLVSYILSSNDYLGLRKLAQRLKINLKSKIPELEVGLNGMVGENVEIKIRQSDLQLLGLSLDQVVARIASQNSNISAGEITSDSGVSKQLRFVGKNVDRLGLARTAIILGEGKGVVYLEDIADIAYKIGDERRVLYDGKPAIIMQLRQSQTSHLLEVAEKTKAWHAQVSAQLPPAVQMVESNPRWTAVQSRLNLLLKNGAVGLILVLLSLFLFLNWRVAFWVGMSIPVVFSIGLFVIWQVGGSINMISMFALIMATGLVVDDSIVVGENISHLRNSGKSPVDAALDGARQMFVPVFAATLTTIATFLPLFIVSGLIGSIIFAIPLVIVSVLIAAVFDCFLILPGHLYASMSKRSGSFKESKGKFEEKFSSFRENTFRTWAKLAVRYRLVTIVSCFAAMALSVALFAGGQVRFTFFPGAELDQFDASVEFVAGTDVSEVSKYTEVFTDYVREKVAVSFPDEPNLVKNVAVYLGVGSLDGEEVDSVSKALVQIELQAGEFRKAGTNQVIAALNENIPVAPGLKPVVIKSRGGGPPGADLEVELFGDNLHQLKQASLDLQEKLLQLPGLFFIEDDLPYGKEQLNIELSAQARALGLSTSDIATQLAAAVSGREVQNYFDGDLEVELRLKLQEEGSLLQDSLDGLLIQLPNGQALPIEDLVSWKNSRGFDFRWRRDGNSAIKISADVDPSVTQVSEVQTYLDDQVLPDLAGAYNVGYRYTGKELDEQQTLADMKTGLVLAIAGIYIILAFVFSSWGLPLVIILTMPLGLIGAVFGHWFFGINMSILSFFGLFTLMGIIVNDSIVLTKYFQENYPGKHADHDFDHYIVDASCRRLRPVVLTSLTTIGGLLPLVLETSTQAQFLVPMAVSISCGLAFATVLILLFNPACLSYYMSAVNALRMYNRGWIKISADQYQRNSA